MARAATGDWDCVILTQKAFEKIDMHPDSQRAYMEEELAQLRAQMERAKEYGEDNRAFKQLERQLVKAEEKLKEKLDSRRDEGAVYWENTGIDYLMVDEAHMFKNLRTPSRIEGAGIAGSTRASDLHMKLHYLRSKSASGRVVTLATGTPIANSVTEAYTMMRYLRPDLLEEAGIEDFDTWAATFGEVVTDVEMNPDGNGFRMKARFAKFQNVPELLRMYRVSADVKTAADLNLPTPAVRRDANGNRGETVVIPADDAQLEYIQELGVRAEAVRARKPWAWVNDPGRGIKGMPQGQYEELYGPVPPQPEDPADRDPNAPRLIEDNMLKISGDGKRAALDMRLIDPNLGGEGAKINTAADKIAEIFNETKDRQFPTSKHDPTPHPNAGALQIVFMDQGTPKPKKQAKKKPAAGEQEDAPAIVGDGDQSTWAAYDEMKAQLVARGIPAEKIRYIHEATTDAQKAKLFEDARIGKIAVLLGSTEKMGTGTNVQARAVALHHMDVPWRPADLAQREGRVERQGNFNRGFNAEGVYDHDLFLSTDPEAPVGDVRIMRYVTEGTFDGYSWQTVERKAKFIAQMQRGNLDVREIEDIGDSALSFAEVKALAAGNPYLLDKAKADAEAHRLERLQRSHARTQAGLSSKIDRLDHEIRITRENIDEWTEAREARVDTRGDAFSMTLDGRDEPVTKRADVYGPILAAVTELRDGPYRDGHRVRIGVLGGHPVYATRARVLRGDNWFRGVKLGFDWPGGTTSYISSEITEGSAQGMLSSLQGRLEKLEPLIEGGRSSLRTMTGQQESARAMLGRPFAYTAQLQAAQARAKLLDDILKTQAILDELKDEEKKPAEERSEAYQTAQAELVVLKASLDVAREQIIPDPAAEPDRDITPVLEDPTPTVSTDRGGFAFLEDAPEHGDAPEPPAQTAPADWERELREVYNAPDAADAVRDLVDALDVPTRTADDQQRIQDALQALDYEVDLVVDGIRDEHMEWGERGEDHVRWLTDMVAEARGRLREQRPGTPSAPSSGSSGSGGSGGRGRRIGGPATEQSDSDTEYPSPPEERAAGMDAAGWERELRERYDAPEAADAVRDLMAVVDAPFPTFEDDPYDEEFEAHMARVRELYEAAGDEVEELRGRLSGEPGWRNSYGEQVTSPNREWLAGLLDELRARTRAQGYDTPFPTGTAADRRDRARARRSGDTTPGTAQDAPATAPQAPDGPAPLDGVSDADMRLLASLIEEEAAAYKWTGSPARYIAELFAKKTGTGRFDGDSDPAVQKWAEDYLAANPGLVDLPASERERRKRERAEREAASTEDAAALTRQSHDRFEAGDYEAALALIDQAEQLDPRGRDWDDIRAIIREERDSTTPAAAVDRPTAVVDPEELQAGDRIRVVRSGSGVHRVRTRGGGSYLAQGDGRVWEGTIPAGYQPGEPVRLDNVIEYNGNQPGRYLAEPAIVRLTGEVERLGTADAEASAAEAARVRTEQQQRGQSLVDELVAARRAMLREEGGDDLLEAVTRFEELLAARNNGDADAAYLEDAWLRADAGLAAAKETTADSLRRAQLRTMQTNLLVQLGNAGGRSGEARRRAAEWEQAKQEAARIADDGLPESADISDVQAGDRVDTPSGEETVTVEEVTRAGGLTFTTERDSDDRRTIRARRGAEQVTRRTSTRKPPEVGPATADNVAVGEWLVGDDGDAVKVVGIDRDGDRITFDVLGPNGPALVDVDAGEMVTRGRGLRMKRPKKPRQPRPLRERTPRSTIVALDDGTPATRIRLRSDIRKRVLGLNVEDDAAASEQAREAAARLRASQPVPAEQMRALSQHLRSLASGEDLPAVQRRALERAAAWVDGSYAKLAGYPAPPHDPGRAVPEKASPENLTAGDVIAIPDVGGGRVRPVRVIDARPVSRFPFVSVTVEHDDGRREQRILAAAADVYLMPDLPEDAETPPAVPVAARREHIRPDQLEPGDTIVVGGQERKVVMAYRFSDPLNPVESWRVYAEGGDGDELVLTSRGFPSVLRTARGEGSADQPWETLLDDSAAEPVTAGQVGLGDRIALDAAHGGVEGTVEELAPLKDSDGTRIGSTAMVRTYGDELVPVALLDGDDSLRITRYQSGGAHAETNIKRWQERRREWDRVRAVRQALGEAETDLYREASAAISEQLSMRRVHPPEPESGDRVWTMAGDLVEQAWQRLDNSAPALQAGRVLAGGDEAHAAALAERIEPLVGQIRERAMYNFIQSIFEANPMPGETYDQALARVLEQFRTDPPRTVDFSLVRRLHVRELFEDGGARPEAVPAPAGDLGERMAAYRKALPGNLGEVGHRQVTRTVYKPLDLEALDDGFDPEIEQVTVTVPDVAADGGPGEYAMRHLAVIKAAGADLDQEVTKRLDSPAYRNAAAAEKTAAEAVAAAEKELAAATDKANREAMASRGGVSSAAAHKEFEKANRAAVKARKAHEAAALRVGELRRQAALDVLSQVRSFGGARLTYLNKNGQARKETHKPVQAMRRVEDVYPAEWVGLLGDHGPVRLGIAVDTIMGGPGRAKYNPSQHAISMPDVSPEEQFRTGVHELGHAFQTLLPGLKEAEHAYLWERTAVGDIGHRERGDRTDVGLFPGEAGYDGGFPKPYTGRVYPTGHGEIFTTGMESLMAGSDYLDDDMRTWLLGVLALLGTGSDGPGKDPLDGVDLDELSVEQLKALLGQIEWGSPAYQRVMAQLRGRRIEDDPLEGIDLDSLGVEDLTDLLGSVDDLYSAARVSEVLEEWDTEDQQERQRNAAIDKLVSSGEMDYDQAWARVHGISEESMRAERYADAAGLGGLTSREREQKLRQQFHEWKEARFWEAETATNGFMLNARGRAAGIDPMSLFSGQWSRVSAYASDELMNWFERNGWKNLTEWRAEALANERDVRAARRSREGRRTGR
ncbi:helicase-related protein [Planomonospora algeriensis]